MTSKKLAAGLALSIAIAPAVRADPTMTAPVNGWVYLGKNAAGDKYYIRPPIVDESPTTRRVWVKTVSGNPAEPGGAVSVTLQKIFCLAHDFVVLQGTIWADAAQTVPRATLTHPSHSFPAPPGSAPDHLITVVCGKYWK